MKRIAQTLGGGFAWLVTTVSACSSRDVVVFEVEPEDDLPIVDAGPDAPPADAADAADADASDATIPCRDLFDCPAYWFCFKNSCADAMGTCEPRPVFCTWEPGPVCGCNGVTYWNDCLRQQLGSAASSPGECQLDAVPCNRGVDCGFQGSHCARLLFPNQACPDGAPEPDSGTCWAIPPDCNAVPDSQRWRHCPLPDEPEGYIPPCVNTCWSIWSELPHLQAQVDTCE